MKHRIIKATTRREYHRHITSLLDRSYVVVDRSDHAATLQRKTPFDHVTLFLGFLCVGFGAAIYVGYWTFVRRGDETVIVEMLTAD